MGSAVSVLLAPFLFLLFFPSFAFAQSDLCDLIKIPNCATVTKQLRRSSMQSAPSPVSAANLNPSNVSFDRGVGLELIAQGGNKVVIGLAAGTGKLGGALISSSLENSFFGNRTLEADEDYLKRNLKQTQYDPDKYSLALGGRLFGKKNFTLDAGIILKRHNELKRVNPGLGISVRLGFLNFGASQYQDDVLLQDQYQEEFKVQTLSAGISYKSFSLDVGSITTKYDFYQNPTEIQLIAFSYTYRNYLFNLARRFEHSDAPKFRDPDLDTTRKDITNFYSGIQVSLGRHLILGVAYNYFLLRELSLNASIFL